MNCELSQLHLHGYLDGELDAAGAANFERHLSSCPECAEALAAEERLRQSLAQAELYERAPEVLRRRIQSSLPTPSAPKLTSRRLWLQLAAAALIGAVASYFAWRQVSNRGSFDQEVAAAAVDAHLRALQPGHLADVESTDQHTVKPWFEGRLDFAPPVRDFGEDGFPLTGGRLDVIHGNTVAALVFARRKHIVSVFVWKPQTAEPGSGQGQEQGYSWLAWQQDGFVFCAVSDAAPADLERLRQLFLKSSPSGFAPSPNS